MDKIELSESIKFQEGIDLLTQKNDIVCDNIDEEEEILTEETLDINIPEKEIDKPMSFVYGSRFPDMYADRDTYCPYPLKEDSNENAGLK